MSNKDIREVVKIIESLMREHSLSEQEIRRCAALLLLRNSNGPKHAGHSLRVAGKVFGYGDPEA